MPIKLNPSSPYYEFFAGATAANAESDHIDRSDYHYHQLQFKTAGATAVEFTVYTSNNGGDWSAIKTQADAVGYSGSTACGVINLEGVYPYFKVVRSGDTGGVPFSASIYSADFNKN